MMEKGTLMAACFDSSGSLQQHLVYTGLARGGSHLAHQDAAVCFAVSAKHRVEKMAGPMEVRIPPVWRCTHIYQDGSGGTSHDTRHPFSRANNQLYSALRCHSLAVLLVQVGEDGRVYAAVEFPTMSELWPDVFQCRAIRIVQVGCTD